MSTSGQKIRIAIIIPHLSALGPVLVIQNLVNSLSDNNSLSIKVFYLDNKVGNNIQMSVPVERLNRKKFLFADYDIIHTNGIRPDLFGFRNRKKIKCHISTIHNFVFEDLAFTYNLFISILFGNIWLFSWMRTDKLVCVSKAMKTYYSKWFPESKMEVIYNGIPESGNHHMPDADVIQLIQKFHSNGLKVLGCVGILTKRKGIDQVLNLIASEAGFATVIIGDGRELSNLKQLSEKLHISDRCEFCGFRSNATGYLKYFDLFIMPSRSEGFGIALIEAIQQKIPVICSDIPVFKELFSYNEVTFFELGDLGSLTYAIKTVRETGHFKAELAYTKYLNHYTSSIMAKNYYELYKSA
jgi:glycosyltransferase involved in cell wall biosynthesis